MKKPRATDIKRAELQEIADNARERAYFRAGKHDSVQRLRHDKGFAKAVAEYAKELLAKERAPYFRDAMNTAMRNREVFEQKLRKGEGIWFDEMQPLAPAERTWVLTQLRKQWQIPEPEVKPPAAAVH